MFRAKNYRLIQPTRNLPWRRVWVWGLRNLKKLIVNVLLCRSNNGRFYAAEVVRVESVERNPITGDWTVFPHIKLTDPDAPYVSHATQISIVTI